MLQKNFEYCEICGAEVDEPGFCFECEMDEHERDGRWADGDEG